MLFLTFSLVLLTYIAYYLNKKSLVSPPILFSGGLTVASIIAWINEKKWNLQLDYRTFFVITLGVLEFIAVAYIIGFLFNTLISESLDKKSKVYIKIPAYVKKRFKVVLIIQILFVFLGIITIKRITGISNLVSATNYVNYVQNGFIQGHLNFPAYFVILLVFNSSAGMMAGYVFIEDIVVNKKFNWPLFFSVLIGFATPILTGARGDSILFLISLAILSYFIVKEQVSWSSTNTKYIVWGSISAFLFIFVFEWSASLVGRNIESINLGDYISTYCGAEIANLNEFIKTRQFPIKGEIFGQQTFVNILPTLSRLFGFEVPEYKLDIPFQILNGHNTGNVATIFYSWLYDFGYMGVFVLSMVASIISEICYKLANKNYGFRIIKLVYGYIGALLVLSFFSNRFFENLNINFVYMILFWIVLKIILFRREKSK
ncbi:hypothetical protein DM475_04320 [Lactobacillus helveticus]|uniref:O-antigen polymerase n=1 Tax=Lactobacillus helveticus TaxID=1587 RepID=UPI000D7C9112|nr:O-antigen polymerase [Lactobacillus helveticus]MCT3408177.1 oligosaccharide repeat unit polymerase [Lactobacillus helveticus]PXZ19741.1 hypothetical protein DM475_04320 [Lactobacillus helveticus]